jgi:hypothetical protein
MSTHRRTLLATVAALAGSTAGCSGLGVGGRVPLTAARRDSTADESFVVYRRDGERLLTFGVLHRSDPTDGLVPFEISVPHADGTRLTAVDLRFTTDGGPQGVPPELYLRRPTGRPFPAVEFGRTSDGTTTTLSIPDLGAQGRSTLTLGFLLAGSTRLTVEARLELAGRRRRYVAEPRVAVDLGES